MKVLYAGFKGNNNPSKLLLDRLNVKEKCYLENDYVKSESQIIELLKHNHFDLIILMGKKPASKGLCIELKAKGGDLEYLTNYDYMDLYNKFIENNIKVRLSYKPGNSLCNNIYYKALEYINLNNLSTKVIFIHLPKIEYINVPIIDLCLNVC